MDFLLFVLIYLYSLTLARPLGDVFPPTVTDDPFYVPPAGYESTAPGTVLRQRPVVTAFFGLIPDPVEAYQLLYRTTSINGSAIATVTTVFKPMFAQTDKFISFQTAYDSAAPKCNPSYNYQLGTNQNELVISVELLIIQMYLMSGYIVASPDYEGPDAAFSAGRLEAMGVLDGMRAVSNFYLQLGLKSNKPGIVGVGYSGGAIATGWAAARQPLYAPELNIKGWASGGTPADLTATVYELDGTIGSGLDVIAIAGLLKPSAYGAQLLPVIDRIIAPHGRETLNFANANCALPVLLDFAFQSIFSINFQVLGQGLLTEPTLAAILQQNLLGSRPEETPHAPILLYHAVHDEFIPYAPVLDTAAAWCSRGASVHVATFEAGGHFTTEILGTQLVMDFVRKAFDNNVSGGCNYQQVLDSTLNPAAFALNLEPAIFALINALGALGYEDSNVQANPATLGQQI